MRYAPTAGTVKNKSEKALRRFFLFPAKKMNKDEIWFSTDTLKIIKL
jgi:hypothetical protein